MLSRTIRVQSQPVRRSRYVPDKNRIVSIVRIARMSPFLIDSKQTNYQNRVRVSVFSSIPNKTNDQNRTKVAVPHRLRFTHRKKKDALPCNSHLRYSIAARSSGVSCTSPSQDVGWLGLLSAAATAEAVAVADPEATDAAAAAAALYEDEEYI